MKINYHIDLDDTIGGLTANKYYVKQMLAKNKEEHVNVRINSLGGSVDDGLDIAEQFKEHGDVTAHIFGLTASAATILALGANKIKMSKNALVLFHRVSNWIDLWGAMNEEQLQTVIEELEKTKEDNKKIDLVLARMYAKKCKRPINEMHEIMCKGNWITAEEAKEIGFVDEIIEDSTQPHFTNSLAAKFNALDIPLPPCKIVDEENNFVNRIVAACETGIKNLFKSSINNQKSTKMKQLDQLNAINECLKIDHIEYDDELRTSSINEEQLNTINELIAEKEKHINDLNDLLQGSKKEIDDLNFQIADLKGQIEMLNTVPAENDERTHANENDNVESVIANAHKMFDRVSNF